MQPCPVSADPDYGWVTCTPLRPADGNGRIDASDLTYARSVLVIEEQIRDAIVTHARRDHPDEACGVVAGRVGSDRPERFVPMRNAAATPYTLYEFASADLFQLYREMGDRDEEPVVVYHSHTHTEAYPSPTDRRLASEPAAHYVLVSTRHHGNDGGPVEFRSFRILDGEVSEEDVSVVTSYDDLAVS
jgi:[CysO sulfur-carrier protein]-S-L-cysteine hydrolase